MSSLIDWLARSFWTTLASVVLLGLAAISIGRALGLTAVGASGLYFIVWWIVLFAILPINVRTQSDLGEVVPGTEPGAPAAPALCHRAIWTSIAATILFSLISLMMPLTGL